LRWQLWMWRRRVTTAAEPDADRAALRSRLRRAEGQLRGVQRMLDEGAECREVLTQLAAAKSAIDRVGLHLIGEELRSCVLEGDEPCETDFEQAMETLLRYGSIGR
jgi:DNA-binding FrmR family transcriptional regulator